MQLSPRLGGTVEILQVEHAGRQLRLVVEHRGTQGSPIWLMLPALSTVSSRSEWRAFADAMGDQCQLVSFDWPGFGDSDRPAITYDASLLCSALQAVIDHVQSINRSQLNVIAAGHSASVALGLAAKGSEYWQQLVLVAPTWRGPLPTMTGWHPKHFSWLRQLVAIPLLGHALYRLNTSRFVLKLMLRRHVWVNPNLLTSKRIREQQQLSRNKGARFASVAFVSGGLDPAGDRDWWLAQARQLKCFMHVLLATEAPPRSRDEMERLANVADRVSTINGRLGMHQEFGATLAERIRDA